MSLDRGMSGNLFAGDYWSMKDKASKDILTHISTDFRKLQNGENYNLVIKPLKLKKKRVVRPIEEALVDEKKKKDAPKANPNDGDDWGSGGGNAQVDREDPDGINEYYRKKDQENKNNEEL